MYAKSDSPLLQSISIHQSRLPLRLGDPLFDESQLKSPKQHLGSDINDSQNISQVMREDNTLSLDKTQLSNSHMLLDNIGPHKPHIRGNHSMRVGGNKESQFFITNEFLNLNYLNNNRTPQPYFNDKPKKSFLNKFIFFILPA